MSSGLEPLTPLLGEWVVESKAFAEGRGHTTVTLTEDGKLMRVHSVAEDQRFPESLMIVGADEASDDYTALYHDSRGVYRVYRSVSPRVSGRSGAKRPGSTSATSAS